MTFWVAGAVVVGSAISSRGASKAAGAQAEAAEQGTAAQERMFERQVELQEPWRQSGIAAQNRLMNLLGLAPARAPTGGGAFGAFGRLFGKTEQPAETAPDFGKYARGFTMADFQQDPGYAFRMSEGLKALERSAAARGGLMSGATGKALQRYGQDLGSQEYMNAFNRYQAERAAQLNPLQSLAGVGQTSANTLTSAAGQLGQGIAGGLQAAGAARASGYVGQANALTSALGTGLNYYQGQQYMNRLFPSGVGNGPPIVSTPYDYGVDQQFSDVRLKTNIVKIGTRSDGLNVYEFDYVWGGPRQVGLMAQEVQNVYPDAVAEVDGYLTVDYAKV